MTHAADPIGGRLTSLGEDGLLRLMGPLLRRATEGLPLGTGDDVAVTPGPADDARLVWTLDTMIEGTHFRFWKGMDTRRGGELLGRKLATVNLSDLASKGAAPRHALLSLAVPGNAPLEVIDGFFHGLDAELWSAGARLIGGDTVRGPQWALTLALVGELDQGVAIAGRHRAVAGQHVYITGRLGASAAGLMALEAGQGIDNARALVHLMPRARLAEGRALARAFDDLAMMDLSDGLAKDAPRLAAASRVGIVLDEAALEFVAAPEARAHVNEAGGDLIDFLLAGGEDYELLLATSASPDAVRRVLATQGVNTRTTRIGVVVPEPGVWIAGAGGVRRPLETRGFEHFA